MKKKSKRGPVRIFERGKEEAINLDHLTAGERMAMVWPLTVDAWTMKGDFDAESRLQRDVIRVIRRKR